MQLLSSVSILVLAAFFLFTNASIIKFEENEWVNNNSPKQLVYKELIEPEINNLQLKDELSKPTKLSLKFQRHTTTLPSTQDSSSTEYTATTSTDEPIPSTASTSTENVTDGTDGTNGTDGTESPNDSTTILATTTAKNHCNQLSNIAVLVIPVVVFLNRLIGVV